MINRGRTNAEHQIRSVVLSSRRLSYAKIVQSESRALNLFVCFAEPPPILCKDSAKREQSIKLV